VSDAAELVDTRTAAAMLRPAEVTLRQWRWRRSPGQPPFVRCGTRSIRYRRQTLAAWALERESQSRSQKSHKPGGRQTHRARGDT